MIGRCVLTAKGSQYLCGGGSCRHRLDGSQGKGPCNGASRCLGTAARHSEKGLSLLGSPEKNGPLQCDNVKIGQTPVGGGHSITDQYAVSARVLKDQEKLSK